MLVLLLVCEHGLSVFVTDLPYTQIELKCRFHVRLKCAACFLRHAFMLPADHHKDS